MLRKLVVLGVSLSFLGSAMALELENIDQATIDRLRAEFKSAVNPSEDFLKVKQEWDCKLYGMRSRLQVQNKSDFYRFQEDDPVNRPPKKIEAFANKGAQVIREYRVTGGGLMGKNGPLTDVIRIGKDRTLIAELSIPDRNLKSSGASDLPSLALKNRVVLSYAVCK